MDFGFCLGSLGVLGFFVVLVVSFLGRVRSFVSSPPPFALKALLGVTLTRVCDAVGSQLRLQFVSNSRRLEATQLPTDG